MRFRVYYLRNGMTNSAAEGIVVSEEWADPLQASPLHSLAGHIEVVNLTSQHMCRLLANLAQPQTLHSLAE